MNSAELGYYERDVGAGKTDGVNASGSVFVCEEANARFYVSFDDRQKIPCKGGFTFRFPEGFKKVTIFNLSTTDTLTVNFYAGNSLVEYTYVRQAITYSICNTQDLLPEAAVDFRGLDSGRRRKSFTLVNEYIPSPAKFVFVDLADQGSLKVWGTSSHNRNWCEVETDVDITVTNPNLLGSGITITVSTIEIFYR